MESGKKSIIRITLTVLIMMAFCLSASAGNSKNFGFLLRLLDLNEAAFAFHRHCLSRTENINETFLRTREFVADELFAEAKIDDPRMEAENIKPGSVI